MGGKSTPDFGDVATSQGEENREVVRDQLYANRPTQYTPWGYSKWTTETLPDGTESWTQTQGLTPELQEILDKNIAMQGGRTDLAGGLVGRMQDEFGNPMNWDGLTPLQATPQTQLTMSNMGGVDDPYQTRQRAEDAMYNSAMSRLQPQFDSRRQELEIKLRNQGLDPQDEAYKSQMQNLAQQETDATQQAIWGATGEGRNEAGQMFGQQMGRSQQGYNQALGANAQNFGQSMQAANYANQIRQQQMTEAMQQRGFSLNEMNALLSGQQVGMPQMPSFVQGTAAQPAPYMTGAAQDASMQQAQSPWSALAGLGGQALGGYIGAGGNFGVG